MEETVPKYIGSMSNKQSRTTDKRRSSSLEVGRGSNRSSPLPIAMKGLGFMYTHFWLQNLKVKKPLRRLRCRWVDECGIKMLYSAALAGLKSHCGHGDEAAPWSCNGVKLTSCSSYDFIQKTRSL
jgi:hypothetical protein